MNEKVGRKVEKILEYEDKNINFCAKPYFYDI